MKTIDIIIIILSVIFVALVVYFAFVRKKDHCSGCPYKKKCNNQSCEATGETDEKKDDESSSTQDNKKE